MKSRKGFTRCDNFDSPSAKLSRLCRDSRSCSTGFTFVETLVVIGIIALLATAVVVVINPAKRFEAARDKEREIHLQAILSAVSQKRAVEGFDCLDMPASTTEDTSMPIFKTIGTTPEDAYYDLFSCLVPIYLDNPLYDPDGGSEADTHYEIWQNPYSKRVTVRYIKKDGQEIVAGPKEYWILAAPTVVTTEPVDEEYITHTSARVEGQVTNEGGAPVWETGVIWGTGDICNTEEGLTILTENRVVGSSLSAFYGDVTGLTHGTEYCTRAYARNDIEVGYGHKVTFTTLDGRPGVKTLDARDVTFNQATLRGEITSLGPPGVALAWGYFRLDGVEIEESGVNLNELGEFSYTLGGLETGRDYSFQACAENYVYPGERCGAGKGFRPETSAPLVTTKVYSDDIGVYDALVRGEVTNTGGVTVTAWGVCFSTSTTPVYPQNCQGIEDPEGRTEPFNFTIEISGLEPGTQYWTFAYAWNEKGRGEGTILSFTTETVAPTVDETIIGDYDHYSAYLGGNISDTGGAAITNHGVCWAIAPAEPGPTTYPANCLTWSGGQEGVFSYKIKNFLADTTYNVKAFARNDQGRTFAPLASFTTASPAQVPGLGLTGVSEVTQTTAELQGTIQNHGGDDILDYGFCWSTEGIPDDDPGALPVDADCQSFGGFTLEVDKDEIDFDFTFTAEGLSMGWEYYVRAFAQNSQGYGYGSPRSFTTHYPEPPSVVTHQVVPATIIGRTAEAGGEITDDGGDPETFGGICYSLDLEPRYPPRTGDPDCTQDKFGEGVFTSQMTGLIGGQTYYYRAYAYNNHPEAPAYGAEYSFEAGSENGKVCNEGLDCKSGHCVDGVCCNSTCTGQTCQTCGEYSSAGIGYCGYVNSSVRDPRNECTQGSSSSDGCHSNNCSGAGYSCGIQTSGDGGCPVCKTCVGATSIACVNYTDNTQDTGCNGTCQACQSGVCGYANAGTDPGNKCTQGSASFNGCRAENCIGTSAACAFQTSGDGGCPVCGTCVGATSIACVARSGSRDTTSPNTCAACKQCTEAIGSCIGNTANTNWAAGLYGCSGSNKRCYGGSCVTCNGYLYNDGCSGCAGQGSKACWYESDTKGASCDSVCGSRGCVGANWDDSSSCTVCLHFYSAMTSNCWGDENRDNAPSYFEYIFLFGCYKRIDTTDQSCSGTVTSGWRVCVCNY